MTDQDLNHKQIVYKTYFLNPRTHILKSLVTQILCNRLLPSHYFIGGKWYKILPLATEAEQLTIIKPMTKPTWEYINSAELATNCIYTEQELDQLRERIMFPVEKPALLNDLAREIESTWSKMWSRIITFGTFSAGIIAIIMLIQFFKTLIDIIIQGYA